MSAPKKIYLQWHGDADPADYPDGPDPDQSDVTWCADKIFEHDIEYVRVDELDRLRAELATRDAKPDCRTCDHCSPDYVCRLTRQISPIVCINGDAYIETSPVRLYEMGEA